jgi:hypothetical protein
MSALADHPNVRRHQMKQLAVTVLLSARYAQNARTRAVMEGEFSVRAGPGLYDEAQLPSRCPGEINTGIWPSRLGESQTLRRNRLTSTAALGPGNDCACEAQPQLNTADPASRQRGLPTITSPQLSIDNFKRKRRIGHGSPMGACQQNSRKMPST